MSWRLAVDIGGTFTDLVGWDEAAGRVATAKVLTDTEDPVRGVTAAIERAGLHLPDTNAFIHGSTIAINAVLQATGAKTALLTTRGFRDVLEMGRKSRPDMYNLFFRPRLCPVPRRLRLEVGERYDSKGHELAALDTDGLSALLDGLPEDVEVVLPSASSTRMPIPSTSRSAWSSRERCGPDCSSPHPVTCPVSSANTSARARRS